MPRRSLVSPDLRAPLLLNGSAGTDGQTIVSRGPEQPPEYQDLISIGSGPPTSDPPDKAMYIDRTNLRLYIRVNDAWVYTQLGALTWQAGA